jgi:hypothetical protein
VKKKKVATTGAEADDAEKKDVCSLIPCWDSVMFSQAHVGEARVQWWSVGRENTIESKKEIASDIAG